MERGPVRGLEHPSCPRQVHPEPNHAPAWKRALTSMAKRPPSRACSEPSFSFSDQCRCSCTARYWAASPPPAMEASSSSSTITGGHKRGPSPRTCSPSLSQHPLLPAPPTQKLLPCLPSFTGNSPGPSGTGWDRTGGTAQTCPWPHTAPHSLPLPLHTPASPYMYLSPVPPLLQALPSFPGLLKGISKLLSPGVSDLPRAQFSCSWLDSGPS